MCWLRTGQRAYRGASRFLFLRGNPPTETATLAPQFNGVVVDTTTQEEWKSLEDALEPRLLLVTTTVTNTTTLAALGSVTDGAQLDNFLREPTSPSDAFRSEADWQRDVAALEALSSNPNLVVLTATRLDTPPEDAAISAVQWFNYTLASFLMGIHNTHTFFGFESVQAPPGCGYTHSKRRLGTALGPTFPSKWSLSAALYREDSSWSTRVSRTMPLLYRVTTPMRTAHGSIKW